MKVSRLALAASLHGALLLPFGSSALAQDTTPEDAAGAAQGGVLGDIIVMAEKRATSLQKTPVAVTAISGEALADANIHDIRDFNALVPSFKAADQAGFGQITIRGIGIQNFTPLAESAVAVNLNQVYLSRPSSFLSSIFDVSAVEVLRGPQGTLYGRNATAGSVNITTRRPGNTLSGNVALTAGNHEALRAEAGVEGPLVDGVLAVRVAGFVEHRGGYGKNLVNGADVNTKSAQAIRGTAVLTFSDQVSATLIAEHYNEDSSHGQYVFGSVGLLGLPGSLGIPPFIQILGADFTTNSYDVYNGDQNYLRLTTTTLTGILEYESGPLTVKSITGYRDQKLNIRTDIDGSSQRLGIFLSGEPADQFSEELQFIYSAGRLNVTAGLYYFDEKDASRPSMAAFSSLNIDPILAARGIVLPPRDPVFVNFANLGGTIYTTSKAAFAQASYEIADGLTAIAGIRFSKDKKRLVSRYGIDPFTPYDPDLPLPPDVAVPSRSFNSTTPKFGLQYQVTPRSMVYATYAKGFKAGSFDPASDPVTTPSLSFSPEKLTSYEAGLKTTMLDGRLRANMAAFYYDYSNLQVSQVVGLGILTQNAGKARIYGLEGEFQLVPVDGLQLALSGAYLNTKYKDYFGADAGQPTLALIDFSGKRLNNAPEWSGVFSAEYAIPLAKGELSLRGEGEFSSKVYFSPGNYDVAGQAGYAKANAFVTYRGGNGLKVSAFVRNLTDKLTRVGGVIQTPFLGNSVQGSLAPPRTYGITLGYEF